MRYDDEILAPQELLRGALNISRAIEIAERESDHRVADDCMSMLLQHLHMAKVVLVHADLLLAGNIDMAARDILSEARETGHVSDYLRPSDEMEMESRAGARYTASRRGTTGRQGGTSRRRARVERLGGQAVRRPSCSPRAV